MTEPTTSSQASSPPPPPDGAVWRWLGATLIFVAEVVTMLSLTWWSIRAFGNPWQWILGIGLPIVVGVGWSLALSPRARYHWPYLPRMLARTAILLAGAWALSAVGADILWQAQVFFVVVGTALTWGWEPPRPLEPVDEPPGVTPAS